eukprot:6210505-Pleurochrysis_carterae.AAC.4
MRVAWAMLKFEKAQLPADAYSASAATPSPTADGGNAERDIGSASGSVIAPLPGGSHNYVRRADRQKHTCSYCGKKAHQYCSTCVGLGLGQMWACGLKTGRNCMWRHAEGDTPEHAAGAWTRRRRRAAQLRERLARGLMEACAHRVMEVGLFPSGSTNRDGPHGWSCGAIDERLGRLDSTHRHARHLLRCFLLQLPPPQPAAEHACERERIVRLNRLLICVVASAALEFMTCVYAALFSAHTAGPFDSSAL